MKKIKAVLIGFSWLLSSTLAFSQDYDIVGLKVGMTYDEVRKILVDYGVSAESLQETHQTFTYTDGDNVHNTEPFLHSLNASKDVLVNSIWNRDAFTIYFSSPPDEAKVVGIVRNVENRNNPPTKGQYIQAMTEKYGEPQKNASRLVWWFPEGKLSCYAGNNLVLSPDIDAIMKKIFLSSGRRLFLDRFQNTKLTNVNDCSGYLVYDMGMLQPDAPANRVTATMIDVPYWVNTNFKSMEWVDQLQKDATEKRLANSPKPNL